MKFTTVAATLSLLGLSSAHFEVLHPWWRGSSFVAPASQWNYPCAGVNETQDPTNRTQWLSTGGSIKLSVSHAWALTYVNLGLGTNVSSFNISLVNSFNQTGNGTFCLKETGKNALAAALARIGLNSTSATGRHGTLQIIQIASTGASLFNCADITLNSTAALLSDDDCRNSTGVSGIPIVNADATRTNGSTAASGSPSPSKSPGAAANVRPMMGAGALVGLAGLVAAVL
ncbi:hypothetical protein B0J11DRAFT_70801 [Dendryphion nanum]|uniref:Copper acquisition factor BIM1-like domain-containing protein n=1 Tax=Dendryphion nanum TaxID=256645 RepID=A0A9P9IGH9_9PLEO|nr:hypothetical protein B0J11DRAFT_70801 [Dendryphion nanum]